MSRQTLYVCAPFATATTADVEERNAAIRVALAKGYAPIWFPACLSQSILCDDVPAEREVALQCAVAVCLACDAVLVVGTRVTEGMRRELDAWLASRWQRLQPYTPATLPQAPR